MRPTITSRALAAGTALALMLAGVASAQPRPTGPNPVGPQESNMILKEPDVPVASAYMAPHPSINTAAAKKMIAACEALAEKNGWKLAMWVLDEAGTPLAMLTMEGVQPVAVDTAMRKAKTALTNQTSTDPSGLMGMFLKDAAGPVLINQLGYLPTGGGRPIWVNGKVVGAFATGGRGPADDVCAKAGIDALAR